MAEQTMNNQAPANSTPTTASTGRPGEQQFLRRERRPFGGRGPRQDRREEDNSEHFEEKVVQVSRVSKKTKGGNQMSFSILVVVGDKKGRVGVGLGKGKDVVSAIKKGAKKAKKNLIIVPMDGGTIPFRVAVKEGAAQIILKPAPKGSGVIAGGPVRAVVEAAGIRDLSSKILGTGNQASNVYATFAALKEIERVVQLKGLKLKSIAEEEAEEAAKVAALQEKAQGQAEATLKAEAHKKSKTGGAKNSTSKADAKAPTKAAPKAKAAPQKPSVKKAESK